jgi:hypothetical protein
MVYAPTASSFTASMAVSGLRRIAARNTCGAVRLAGYAVQAFRRLAHPPREAISGGAGPLVRLAGHVPGFPRLGAFSAGVIEGSLGGGKPVVGGAERCLRSLHSGLGFRQRVLGRGQPAAQLGQLPHRMAAFPGPVCHESSVPADQEGFSQRLRKLRLMNETWVSRDLPVLDAVVELLEDEDLVQPEAVAERTGLDLREVLRALHALDRTYVRLHRDMSGGFVDSVTPEARRAVGQWPSGESLIRQIADGLAAAAEEETDPEQKSRLRQAAALLGGAVRDIAIGVAERYAERMAGMGWGACGAHREARARVLWTPGLREGHR